MTLAACSSQTSDLPDESAGGPTNGDEESDSRDSLSDASAESSTDTFTHVIGTETEYYTTGPQQGRPPDGKSSAGTQVNIVEEAGSYTLVRSEDGMQAYEASDALKQAANTAMIVFSRKVGEVIVIADNITVTVVEIGGDEVRLGIEAPKKIPVHRKEVYDAIKNQQRQQR
jgi:carbon storage regulator